MAKNVQNISGGYHGKILYSHAHKLVQIKTLAQAMILPISNQTPHLTLKSMWAKSYGSDGNHHKQGDRIKHAWVNSIYHLVKKNNNVSFSNVCDIVCDFWTFRST